MTVFDGGHGYAPADGPQAVLVRSTSPAHGSVVEPSWDQDGPAALSVRFDRPVTLSVVRAAFAACALVQSLVC